MAEQSLIEEMRAAMRGDRERAEQRRTRESPAGLPEPDADPPAEARVHQPEPPPAGNDPPVEPEAARNRAAWMRWMRAPRER